MNVVDIREKEVLIEEKKKENKCIVCYQENWPIILCLTAFISIVTIAIILSIRMNS